MIEVQTAKKLQTALRSIANPEKAQFLQRFFKTGKGEYAEGDLFLGITVPEQRLVVKAYKHLPISEVSKLLKSKWHEDRLTVLLILVAQFKKGDVATKEAIYQLYINHTNYINNWDLIDSTAEYIVGTWLEDKDKSVLIKMAHSELLWDRRIAMIATFCYIKKGNVDWALKIAAILVKDSHDLIQKAVGWMLREIGKRCSQEIEEQFLEQYYKVMPRTMLRYAIERFEENDRLYWLKKE